MCVCVCVVVVVVVFVFHFFCFWLLDVCVVLGEGVKYNGLSDINEFETNAGICPSHLKLYCLRQ